MPSNMSIFHWSDDGYKILGHMPLYIANTVALTISKTAPDETPCSYYSA